MISKSTAAPYLPDLLYAASNPLQAKQMLGIVPHSIRSSLRTDNGRQTQASELARLHPAPRKTLPGVGKGERQKYIKKVSKQTKLSDNSLRRMIAASQFLEAEGITDLPPGGRLPLGSVENIARIAAHEPSRRMGTTRRGVGRPNHDR